MEWIVKLTDAEIILELFGIQQHLDYLQETEDHYDDREYEDCWSQIEHLEFELRARERRSA